VTLTLFLVRTTDEPGSEDRRYGPASIPNTVGFTGTVAWPKVLGND
jgi:hypothetical protein